jgi:hypothetical protein
MENVLLKKLVLGAAIAGSAMFVAKEARAEAVPWSSYTDIVPASNPNNGNPISSVSYTSSSSIGATNNLSAVYFIVTSLGLAKPVGGFDMRNGQVTSCSFNGYGAYYGLWAGDTANSAEGSNPQNHYPGGYWEVFYDSNNDGSLGTIETDEFGNFQYFLNGAEQLADNQYSISNFTAFDINNPGSFTFSTTILGTPSLAIEGLNTSAIAGGTNLVTLSVSVSNAVTFRVEFKTSLTNVTWQSLGTYSRTGDVMSVTDTNTAPQCFYRVVTP